MSVTVNNWTIFELQFRVAISFIYSLTDPECLWQRPVRTERNAIRMKKDILSL